MLLDTHEWRFVRIAEWSDAAFIQHKRSMLSQNPTQFCLSEYKRPIALKCVGQS